MYPWKYLFGFSRFSHGAWYEPSRENDIQDALKLLELKVGDMVVDLGSGDGRVAAEMFKSGALTTGIEENEKLILVAKRKYPKIKFEIADFWKVNLSVYNKVFVYQFKNAMPKLKEKLHNELMPGSVVVSNYWAFPDWKVEKQIRYSRKYVI